MLLTIVTFSTTSVRKYATFEKSLYGLCIIFIVLITHADETF